MTPLEQFSKIVDATFGVTTSRVEPAGQRVRCTDCGRSVLEDSVLRTDEKVLCGDCVMDRLFTEYEEAEL